MKKVLFTILITISSLQSYCQEQKSSPFIHHLSVGIGINGPDVSDAKRLTFYPLISLRYNFNEHWVVEANTFRILSFDKNFPVNYKYSSFYFGLERRFKISNKFKFLAGVYGGYNYYHFNYYEDDKQTNTGIGPIAGLEYKLSPKFYLLSEMTILYGTYNEINDGFRVANYNTLFIPKFLSLEIYYKF